MMLHLLLFLNTISIAIAIKDIAASNPGILFFFVGVGVGVSFMGVSVTSTVGVGIATAFSPTIANMDKL